jgi:type II secretory pathway component PulL
MTYTIAWIFWIAYFLVVEFDALLHNDAAGTLSDHIWAWFSMRGYGNYWRLRRFILLAFLAWLAAHILTAGKF